MKDAFGGILNLTFITIFLLLVSGILGLTVSYTKAFRVKNLVISSIENFEGTNCFGSDGKDSDCQNRIREGAKKLGYAPTTLNCPRGSTKIDNLFCYSVKSQSNKKVIYSITTQVDINIPLVSNILGLSIFQVHGDTTPIIMREGNNNKK